jgi:undecaprenyl diphosphate synthase
MAMGAGRSSVLCRVRSVIARAPKRCGAPSQHELGVPYLTLFAFSSENWKRPADEVDDLMWLLRSYLQREVNELNRQGVRIGFIGERSALGPELVALIENAERDTAGNNRLIFTIAVNYGGQQDIVAAAQHLAQKVAAGRLRPDQINAETFAAHLMTTGLPDPDLIIRTSGEQRLSNFMLWQAAYSELVFIDTLWPDFSRQSLEQAIDLFNRRERRYGATASG